MSNKPPHKAFLDPTSGNFVASRGLDSTSFGAFQRHTIDDENRRQVNSIVFGSNDGGFGTNGDRHALGIDRGYPSSYSGAASTNGSLPPSRNGTEQTAQYHAQHDRAQHPQFGQQSPFFPSHRSTHSARTSSFSSSQANNQQFDDSTGRSREGDMIARFGKISMDNGDDQLSVGINGASQFPDHSSYEYGYNRQMPSTSPGNVWGLDEGGYQNALETYAPPSSMSGQQYGSYQSSHLGERESDSPGANDYRRVHNPSYSSVATPPVGSDQYRAASRSGVPNHAAHGQAALLERKLKGLQQEQQGYVHPHSNPLQFRGSIAQSYDYNPQNGMRMNPLAPYYQMAAVGGFTAPVIPRGPSRDHDLGQNLRSALLEEFRSNNKTSKRYELKVCRLWPLINRVC